MNIIQIYLLSFKKGLWVSTEDNMDSSAAMKAGLRRIMLNIVFQKKIFGKKLKIKRCMSCAQPQTQSVSLEKKDSLLLKIFIRTLVFLN